MPDEECTGIVDIDGKKWYVSAGLVIDYTGLIQSDGTWYLVVNGCLDEDYNGTVQSDGKTFRVENGIAAIAE